MRGAAREDALREGLYAEAIRSRLGLGVRRMARAVLAVADAEQAELREQVALWKDQATRASQSLAEEVGRRSERPPLCCIHGADAHDGSGCLDCACAMAPFSPGYNPNGA